MKKALSLLLALALCLGLSVPALAAGFTDVPASSPFAAAIGWAVEKGVTKGTTPTTFGPGNTCTTSHILTFLWRAAGRPGDGGDEQAAVTAWASGLGIDVSDLGAPCTRAAAVDYIRRAQGRPAAKEAASFTDVAPSASYAGAVSWAVEAGVTKGTGNGVFSPESVCTRGQIVTFLHRALAGGGNQEAKVPETPAGDGVLTNGKPATEENVLAMIQELLKKYPKGMAWETYTFRTGTPSTAIRQLYSNYTWNNAPLSTMAGCSGFASLVSDSIFGSGDANPARKVPVEYVRPGDVIIKLNSEDKLFHVATAASRTHDIYEVSGYRYPVITMYDGNHSGKVLYDTYAPIYSKTNPLYDTGEYVEVWTRYPSENTTPWTGETSSTSDTPSSVEITTPNTPASTPAQTWEELQKSMVCDFCGKAFSSGIWSTDRTKRVCNDCYQANPSRTYKYLDS